MFGRYFGAPYFGRPYFGEGGSSGTHTSSGTIGAVAGCTAAAYVARRRGREWVAIAAIDLDDDSQFIAARKVTHPSRIYRARVLAWGNIDRSIPLPSGMPQAARMKIRVDFTDAEWRRTIGAQTLEGRRVRVKFMQAGTSEAAADKLFSGLIDEYNTGPGYLEIGATSDMMAWLDEKQPEVINQANFPEFPNVKQQHFPLVLGHLVGRAVSIGYAAGPPAGPPSGALVAAADAADVLRGQIAAITWSTGPFAVFFIAQEFAAFKSKYNQGLGLIVNEFNSEYASGDLEFADAAYARGKLQDLLDATAAKLAEFAAINSGRAGIAAQFTSEVTSFYGADWSTLMATIDARIDSVAPSPPAEAFAPQGALQLPHIGFAAGIGDRWGASTAGLWNVLAIYRKQPGESIFTPVDPGEFDVTVQAREFYEYPDQEFSFCTFIDFLVEQPEGTEIRMDADGAYYRGAFGAMPAVGYAPGEGLTDPGPLRNPVDGMLLMREWVFPKAGTAASFDITALAALRVKFRDGGATMPALLCDAAVAESLTPRELLGRFHSSFQTDFFETKAGLLTMVRIDDTDEGRPVLTQSTIVRNSFHERSPETLNRFRAQYAYDYATGTWTALALADNLQDQIDRGKVKEQTYGLWFVRDAITATAAVYDRLRSTALRSLMQRMEVPLTAVSSFLDLARLIGITHRHGLSVSGYTNREVKVTGVSINLDGFRATIDSIVRAPLNFGSLRASGFTCGAFAGAAAQLTNRFRPTAYTMDTAPGGGVRGTFSNQANVLDQDADSYMQELLNGTRATSTYAISHFHDFEPFSTAGLVSVDIFAVMEYLHHGNSGAQELVVRIDLFDGINNVPPAGPVAALTGPGTPHGPYSADQAKAAYSVNISAAAWNGLASPTVRAFMWNSSFQDFSPDVEMRIFDIYVRPNY